MEFLQHTSNWIKGELFESKIIFAFGLFAFIVGFLFWKIGDTPNAKALFYPLLVTSLIYGSLGASMYISNQKRIVEFENEYKLDNQKFVHKEKQRVESFQYQYTISKIVATICFLATLLIFWITKNATWQGIGLGLTIFGIIGLMVDYFSEERASIYYKHILESLG